MKNNEVFDLDNIKAIANSPLKGKKVAFLGSSITYGEDGISFVECLAKRNSFYYLKEAVSGTTLVDFGPDSYIKRLKKINPNEKFDIFVCQLSTNDIAQNMPFGDLDDKNVNTVLGAINYIYQYVKKKWNCPFIMYTSAYYDSENYQKLVNLVKKMKYIKLIDMYSDVDFNNLTIEQRKLFMLDGVHPSKLGYLKWWTPYIEKELYALIQK